MSSACLLWSRSGNGCLPCMKTLNQLCDSSFGITDEGTYCPGFQFRADMSLNQVMVMLFKKAMELRIPHNYFALWMMLPCSTLGGSRPVDLCRSDDAPMLVADLDRSLAVVAA